MADPPPYRAPIPPAPAAAGSPIRGLFVLNDASRRWPYALRATVCMGAPVLVGSAAGDVTAGLMATIGAFTALYGSGRPYLNRAVQLALIAVSFALSVALGVWASAESGWLAVLVVGVIAMAAVLVCNALAVGPPGAYMLVLACAAGTGMAAVHLNPVPTGLLVLAGGAFAWLVHMSGALFAPRGPEKSAVVTAADAVGRFIAALGTPGQDAARHWAAVAMHESWAALVSEQPVNPQPDSTLSRLRFLNRQLHLLLAETMVAADASSPLEQGIERARAIGEQAKHPSTVGRLASHEELPLGRPGPFELLRQALTPGSTHLPVIVRVGIATVVAGGIAAALGVEHAYWAMAAAVLMLHQGFDWVRTVQRGLERMLGTFVGLFLSGAVLATHPQGILLALTIMALQFIIQMSVLRNYALSVIFITPIALTIASGGRKTADVSELVLARGVDTAIGCGVALLVYVVTARRGPATRMPEVITRTVSAALDTAQHLARGAVTTPEALLARRTLQLRAIELLQHYDTSVGASPSQRVAAERSWPAVVATQRLAYRMLSACWGLERVGGGGAAQEVAQSLLGTVGELELRTALDQLTDAIRRARTPEPLGELPAFIATEVTNLRDSLVGDPDGATPPTAPRPPQG